MTNEIPVGIFLFLLGVQFILLIYSLVVRRDGERIDYMITIGLSAILGWMNANMILNGNVNMIQSDGATYSYIPVQSLPLHYFLLAVAIVSIIILFWFIIEYFRKRMEKDLNLSSFDGDW